jgi:hypothetical protein
MHFGENQLSPGSIGISPLPTGHPPVLQHWWVRASTRSHPRFTLPMASSPGFGPAAGDPEHALFRLAFAPAPRLFPPLNHSRRHQLAGSFFKRHAVTRPAAPKDDEHLAPTARGCGGSGSLSSPSRGAFHPSLTVLVRYRWQEVLQPWRVVPPASRRISRVPRYSGTPPSTPCTPTAYGTLTPCGGAFQRLRPDVLRVP